MHVVTFHGDPTLESQVLMWHEFQGEGLILEGESLPLLHDSHARDAELVLVH